MLSVCVPVYNCDVRKLAKQLSDQVKALSIPAEILFYDDGSENRFREINREIGSYKSVKYFELPANMGRAAIRNRLAQSARFTYLVYLDADSELPGNDFLKRYAENVYNAKVICGGTIYDSEPPEPEKMLRWVYGRKREQLSPAERQKKGFSITANNFLVSRDIILKYPFRETISGYGHEDTVLGYDLHKAGIQILHIDNPVVHKGLETSEEYLSKTGDALKNLLLIDENFINDPEFGDHSFLLKIRKLCKTLKLRRIVAWLFRKNTRVIEKNLTGPKPRLWVFDLYKIGFFCTFK